jgi:hypothetical protein
VHPEPADLPSRSAKNRKVMKTVLGYFVRNPRLTDSLEGIVRWRLLEEALHERVIETEAALRELVDAGYLLEEQRVGTERLYRLNEARLAAASRLAGMADETPRAAAGTRGTRRPRTKR